MKDGFPVSVAELLTAGQRPLPSEAVAIVLDVCRQVLERPAGPSVLPPISTGALFIDGGGRVAVAGGVPAEDDQTVRLLARVLLHMLPPPGTHAGAKVPSRLRGLAARAAAGDSPRLTVGRFAAALLRFGPPHPAAAVQALFRRWNGERLDHRTSELELFGGAAGSLNDEAATRSGSRTAPAGPGFQVPGAGVLGEREPARPALPIRAVRGLRRHSLAIGVLLVALVVLAGIGARYWLNAKEILPPLPVNPAILLREPPAPARGGWELLNDPAGLSVDAQAAVPTPTDGAALPSMPLPLDRRQAGQAPGTAGGRKARSGLDAPFAHKPLE